MKEQSPDQRRPKIRRAGVDNVEEHRTGATRAESTDQAQQEIVSETLLHADEADQEVSRAAHSDIRKVKSELPWPFRATEQAVEEWTHFLGRALERNSRAAADLRACDSVASVLRWQWDLMQSNVEDWLTTSSAVLGVFRSEGSCVKAATETASA